MRIKMLETRRGSEDGFAVHQYHKGCIYDVADSLAVSFIVSDWALNVSPPPVYPGDNATGLQKLLYRFALERWGRMMHHTVEQLSLRVTTNPATGRIEP
jgi:hypothetical protein